METVAGLDQRGGGIPQFADCLLPLTGYVEKETRYPAPTREPEPARAELTRKETMKPLLRRALTLALIATTAFAIASTATAAVAPAPTGLFSGSMTRSREPDRNRD